MAIFHLHCSYGSRVGGQSALAAALYVLREGKYARGRDDLVVSGCGNLPAWCDGDPVRLFAAADRYERANGRLYVEAEGALPVELDLEQQDDLVRAFMAEFAPGLPFVYGMHAGRPTEEKPRNRHFHGLVNERVNDGVLRDERQWFRRANRRNPAAGGAPKDRSLKGHGWVDETRNLWERLANEALEQAGRPERVTAQSHRDRIARAEADGDHETAECLRLHPPGVHVGPTASAIERGRSGRPGRMSDRGGHARARAANAARLRAEVESVDQELKEHERAAVAAARDAGVEEGLIATAQSGSPDKVVALDVATDRRRQEIRAAAWAVELDDEAIERVRDDAEPDDPELGWRAVAAVTAERRERRETAVSAAGSVGLDVHLVYSTARQRDVDPVVFLEQETDNRRVTILAAARAELLEDKEIRRLFSAAESRRAGSGWQAVVDATVERRQEKADAERAAGNVGLDVAAVYLEARDRVPGEDPVHYLKTAAAERADEMIQEAQRALLNPKQIAKIIREAESRQAGSGLRTLVEVTAVRRTRKDAAERAALAVDIDGPAFFALAWEPDTDPIQALEQINWKRASEIMADARAALFDEKEIHRIRDEAESRQPASGLRAVVQATRAREEEIREAARAVSLDRSEIERIRSEAALEKAGSEWAAVIAATAERNERRLAAELAARNMGLDIDAVDGARRNLGENPVTYLEGAVAKRQAEIEAEAEEVLLDDETIAFIFAEAESKTPGSGWRAIVEATEEQKADFLAAARAALLDDEASLRIRAAADSKAPRSGWATLAAATTGRRKRKDAAESKAGECGLDIEAIYAGATERNEDPIKALEQEIRVERLHLDQQAARYETLVGQPGGRDLYNAWLTELDPAWRSGGKLTGELVDRALDAAEADSRLERLTRALEHGEAASFYHGEVDTDHQVTLSLIDEAVEAAEEIVRRSSVAAEQGDLGCAAPTTDSTILRLAWKIERAVDAAEAALPTAPRNLGGPDSTVPAASNDTLDRVAAAAPNLLLQEMVEEVRDRYDEKRRRESEIQYLSQATTIEHARATRSWKASRDGPTPTRDSVEATVREKHRSAVHDAFRIACDGMAAHGESGALTLDERGRLARYLSEERLPFTTPYPANPSHRPFAVSDATFDAAEAAAGTRRVAETVSAIRSLHWYTASARQQSESSFDWKKGTGPEEIRDVVIEIIEDAWHEVDRLDLRAARRELDRRDYTRGDRERRRIAQPPTSTERVGPTRGVSSRKRFDKPRASTGAERMASTDDEPDRGGRPGR